MGLNPNAQSGSQRRNQSGKITSITTATVTSAPPYTGGDDIVHSIEVSPDYTNESYPVEVAVAQKGDVAIPAEGDDVLIGARPDERPVMLASRYTLEDTIPEYEPGERRIGHPLTDSHVELQADGTIHIENDAGTTIALQSNGDVVIDGGTNQPVTDITTH